MARFLPKAGIAALVLLALFLVVVGAGRYAAGALVASDGFRETTARQLERALKPFVPHALVAVEESEIMGLSQVVLRRMSVRSEQKIDAAVAVSELRVTPRWLTVLRPGPTEAEVKGTLGNGGSLDFVVAVPLAAILRGRADSDATVELTGAIAKADAATVLALLLASGQNRAPRLARGLLDGEIALSKAIGEDRATAKKTGRATLRFYEAAYSLEGTEQKLAPFDASLELRDYTVRITDPFIVESASHENRAVVGGAFLLPRRDTQNVGWDLEVTADGRPDFKDDLAQLFSCKAPPTGPRFKVSGPVADARCHAVIALNDSHLDPTALRERR